MTRSSPAPTEDEHFKGRYNPLIGIALILLGAIATLVSLWLMLLNNQFNVAIVIGLVALLFGYLYLTRPYFTVAPNRLTVYNPIGKVVKRYPFESFNHLYTEKSHLYIESGYSEAGSREKVNLNKWMVRAQDWRQLEAITHSSDPQL